ncbi:hypothetical protein JHK82_033988 [Glycine max]|nr:hypothetical protein JHK86_034062 [Glycine max]KAG5119568.1 hypothetical protein JHK82_033988 [Glycine max]KAG5140558.1 hypothetical protein JHK84_034326 [Glycine max]
MAGTLGYSGWKGLKNLGELASGDYPTFGALIWRRELIDLTLLLLTGSESILFGVGSLGIAGAEKCAGLEPEKRHANRGRILAFQKLGGIDGDPVLRGTRIRATWEYVSSVEGGQLGMVGSCVICGCGELICTITRSPPSTTCDGYPIILQA